MDNVKTNIIIGIISVLFSGLGGYFSREPKVIRITRESEQRKARIITLEKEKSILQSLYSNLEYKQTELQNSYNILYSKYQKCISPAGAIFQIGSFDFYTTYQNEFTTNDILEFKIVSTSIFIKIIRISKRGPVIKIDGCEYYLTENGINSTNDGKHAFYLPTSRPFYIKYSLKSCVEGNASISKDDIEVIQISVIDFDVEEQQTKLEYKRTLYKL